MGKVAQYTPAMIEAYLAKGYWRRELTVDLWGNNATRYRDAEALVDSRVRLTWVEAGTVIHRVTAALLQRGLKKDDILLCQLYNSAASTLVRLACEKAGIVLALVPPTFREAEIAAVLGQTQAVGAIFPTRFGRFDYWRMFSDLQSRFDHLEHLFVVGEKVPCGSLALDDITRTHIGLRIRGGGPGSPTIRRV